MLPAHSWGVSHREWPSLQRMVFPECLSVAAGAAPEPGEGEAGFEAGALASELRLGPLCGPFEGGMAGSPV